MVQSGTGAIAAVGGECGPRVASGYWDRVDLEVGGVEWPAAWDRLRVGHRVVVGRERVERRLRVLRD